MAKMDIEIYEKLLTDSNPKPGYYVEGGRMRRLKDRDRFDGEDLEFDDDDSEFGIPVLSFTSGHATSGHDTSGYVTSGFVFFCSQFLILIKSITYFPLWNSQIRYL